MNPIQKILVATDYSEQARKAETRAAMLSLELRAASLEMMAVRPAPADMSSAESLAPAAGMTTDDIATLERHPGAGVASLRKEGAVRLIRSMHADKPPRAIVARARETGADLAVTASQTRGLPGSLFGQGRDDELIRMTEGPLLLVKRAPRMSYRRVVVAVDFSDASFDAARTALLLAPQAHIILLHAAQAEHEGMMREAGIAEEVIASYRRKARAAGQAALERLIERLGATRQLISRVVEYGHAVPVVLESVRRHDADLLAIGKHSQSWLRQLLLGSVAQRLACGSACDTLIVPPTGADDWPDRPAA